MWTVLVLVRRLKFGNVESNRSLAVIIFSYLCREAVELSPDAKTRRCSGNLKKS